MKTSVLFLIFHACFAAFVCAVEPAVPSPIQGALRWQNGETIRGAMGSANATGIRWSHPAFSDALSLDWAAVHRIFQATPFRAAAGEWCLRLKDGSMLFGTPMEISTDTVRLETEMHGEVWLKRADVLSLRRTQSVYYTYSGPNGDDGWGLLENRPQAPNARRVIRVFRRGGGAQRKPEVEGKEEANDAFGSVPQMVTGPRGTLSLPYWRTAIYRDMTVPKNVECEFHVTAKQRPEFCLTLQNGTNALSVETWGPKVVLVSGESFQVIETLPEDARSVALRVFWNPSLRDCIVVNPSSGKMIMEGKIEKPLGAPEKGVVLESRGRDLTLESLKIRPWLGPKPRPLDMTIPAIQRTGGGIEHGKVVSATCHVVTFHRRDEQAVTIPWEGLDTITFSTKPVPVPDDTSILTLADRTRLVIQSPRFEYGQLAAKTAFAYSSLKIDPRQIREWIFPRAAKGSEPAPDPSWKDRLSIGGSQLSGRWITTDGERPLWLSAGIREPVRLSDVAKYTIRRAGYDIGGFQPSEALLHTAYGDLLPITLEELNRETIRFRSSMIESTQLPAKNVSGIQLCVKPPRNVAGFDAPDWIALGKDSNSIKAEKGQITIPKDMAYAHPTASLASEISFVLHRKGMLALQIQLFGTAPEQKTESVNLMLGSYGTTLICGLQERGDLTNERRENVGNRDSIPIKLVIDEKFVAVYANGAFLQRHSIPLANRHGPALILSSSGLWGNTPTAVKCSDFQTVVLPLGGPLPSVPADSKKHLLRIPRFRKSDLPQHAVIAHNGDVLRGEVEALTTAHVSLRLGLEKLAIPRERIAAIIPLRAPNDPRTDRVEDGQADILVKKVQDNTFTSGSVGSILEQIRDQVPGFKFSVVPGAADRQEVDMEFRAQTLEEALDEICRKTGLMYQLKDGVVQFSKRSEAEVVTKTIERVYWLPTFPAVSPAALLKDKGIEFEGKASAYWDDNRLELVVSQTEEMHRKLAPLLRTEFQCIGSPTHWVSVMGGSAFSFRLESIADGVLRGWHPIYGKCQISADQVLSLSSQRPDATSFRRTLEDWRIALQPEPTSPETGKSDSKLVGKIAPDFKLPLLDGKEFALAKQKGKVVVLDFWATWCGPCVKSLPGLIEALAEFPSDQVEFLTVNQGEPGNVITPFMEARSWKMQVALDSSQSVANRYGVEGIPHTTIIGRDGKVAWEHVGFSPEGAHEVAEAVRKQLKAEKAVP